MAKIDAFFNLMFEQKASDLHLSAGNNPMLRMENVTLTAHVASASARFDEARKRRVGYELSLVLQGMWPVSCVNPSVLQNTSLRRWQPVSMDRGPNS